MVLEDPVRAVAEAVEIAIAQLERSGATLIRPTGFRLLERAERLGLNDQTTVELGLALLQNQVFVADKSPRIIAFADLTIVDALVRLAGSRDVDPDTLLRLRAERSRVNANLIHQQGNFGLAAEMYKRSIEQMKRDGSEDLVAEQLHQESLLSASLYLDGQQGASRRLADETKEQYEIGARSIGFDYHMAKLVEHELKEGAFDGAVDLSERALARVDGNVDARPLDSVVLARDRAEGLFGIGEVDRAIEVLHDARALATSEGLTDQIQKIDELAKRVATALKSRRYSMTEPAPPGSTQHVDVLVVTTTDFELLSTLEHLGGRALPSHGETMAELREITIDGDERLVVAVVRGRSQGQTTAQRTTRRAIETLDPSAAVLVGIAGALPSTDIFLGDVLVATSVLDFSVDARKTGGRQEWNAEPVGGLDPFIHDAAPMIPSWQRTLKPWPRIVDRADRRRTLHKPKVSDHPGSEPWDDEIRAAIAHARTTGRDTSPPVAVVGNLATSNTLHKDPDVIAQWTGVARKLLAVEMESAGVLAACDDAGVPALVVRGISDIVGLRRDEAWTHYASESVATFLASLVRSGIWPRAARHLG